MSADVDPLSCPVYRVRARVQGADREAVLASPAGVIFVAALEVARAAWAAKEAAKVVAGDARAAADRAYRARAKSTPEGHRLSLAGHAARLADEATWPLSDAVEAAETREALDRFLGREPAFSADGARAALEAACEASEEAKATLNGAIAALWAVCADEQKAANAAWEAFQGACAESERADNALREANEPIEAFVSFSADHI